MSDNNNDHKEQQKEEEKTTPSSQLAEGYTAGQAAEVMSLSSKKEVSPDYVRKLASKGLIHSIFVNKRLSLYNKEDVNGYKVEDRGKKAGRAAQARTKKSDKQAA